MFLITLDRDIRGCTTHAFFILRTYSVSVAPSHYRHSPFSPYLAHHFTYLRTAQSYRANMQHKKQIPGTKGFSGEPGISSRKRIGVSKVSNSNGHGWHVTSRGRSPNSCFAPEMRQIYPPFAIPMTAHAHSMSRNPS